jgi:hypothetical protein
MFLRSCGIPTRTISPFEYPTRALIDLAAPAIALSTATFVFEVTSTVSLPMYASVTIVAMVYVFPVPGGPQMKKTSLPNDLLLFYDDLPWLRQPWALR